MLEMQKLKIVNKNNIKEKSLQYIVKEYVRSRHIVL